MKKNKNKKTKNNKKDNKYIRIIKQSLICLVIAIIIYMTLGVIVNYITNSKIILKENTKSIFTSSDLTVKNLSYNNLESVAITEFGVPKKIEKFKHNKDKYKKYIYDGMSLTFKDNNGMYILMKATITSSKYLTSRDIRVGDNINDVINKYSIENTNSNYLYGVYNEDDFTKKSVYENIYYGKKSNSLVYYLYAEAPFKKGYASWKDDIAQISYEVKFGKVKKIEWMFGPVDD